MEAKKNDFTDKKLRWDLLPLKEIEKIVKVYTAGSENMERILGKAFQMAMIDTRPPYLGTCLNMKKDMKWMKKQVVNICLRSHGMRLR